MINYSIHLISSAWLQLTLLIAMEAVRVDLLVYSIALSPVETFFFL